MKISLRHTIVAVALATAFCASAEIPAGYYSSLNGKTKETLKQAVRDVIYPHTEVSSYSDLPNYFRVTDVYPNYQDARGYLRWWEMYSDIPLYTPPAPQRWSFNGLNREHSFPKSWWGGGTDTPAYTDLNHLYPGEAAANMAKSNYPLGTVMTPKFNNGVTKVGYPVAGQGGGAAQVFEPADEYKGDFARAYMYMVTCYSNLSWNSKYLWMIQQNSYPTLTPWAIDLLLQWNRNDPVSQKELDRNEKVYQFQNNRNPFIDFPDLCEYIWGDKMGQPFTVSSSGTPAGDPILITPVQDMALDFGEVAVNNTGEAKLHFKGENCTGAFTITVSPRSSAFASDARTISAAVVNSPTGYWLTVKYSPTEVGEHTARLIVSDGGLVGSRGIELRGSCLPVPTLSALTATAATDISDDFYVANWEEPVDEVVDYYVVTRTRYVNGNATSEELEAETNSLIINEFDSSDSESYSVQSVRLGYRSPMSNVIFVEHAGVAGVKVEQPLAINCYPGYIRFICGEPNTNARIYDMAGRSVKTIPVVENDMEVSLPTGFYFIVTDQHHTPLKAVAY